MKQKVTNGDRGGRGVLNIGIFAITSFLNGLYDNNFDGLYGFIMSLLATALKTLYPI